MAAVYGAWLQHGHSGRRRRDASVLDADTLQDPIVAAGGTWKLVPLTAKLVFDICHVCGEHKKLSFEHVPPKAAFNANPILRAEFEKALASENIDELRCKVHQRGSGAYTTAATTKMRTPLS
jgi:hypothetical protein